MKKIFLSAIILLIIFGSLGSTLYFYTQYNNSQKLLKDPTAASKLEIKNVTAQLSKFMDLPKDEEPTVATVLDKEKIKDQPFFSKAENGDKVVVYAKSAKAILFRPSTGRIIDIAPVNSNQDQGNINIIVLNGTKTVGLARNFSSAIKSQSPNVMVLAEDTAKNTTYSKSIVVDLTGKKADLAKQMAELIGGEVSALPDGETVPATGNQTADLLVIVGANLKITSVPSVTPSVTPSATEKTVIATPTEEVTPTPKTN